MRAHGIHVTPLTLVDGDASYRDGVDITAEEFHAKVRRIVAAEARAKAKAAAERVRLRVAGRRKK